jgi:cell division protein FtsZ
MVRVSVVATGMDGASIAAIEPYEQPRKKAARPSYTEAAAPAEDLEPALDLVTPAPRAPEPAYATATAAQPAVSPTAPAPAAQPDLLFDAPAARRTAASAPVKTIVDPSVAEPGEEEPLFGGSPYLDDRRQKSGFMTMFSGRRSRDQNRRGPPARTGNAQPIELPDESETDSTDELEIPSFLRRLAN